MLHSLPVVLFVIIEDKRKMERFLSETLHY
jgi:hypothetical protein